MYACVFPLVHVSVGMHLCICSMHVCACVCKLYRTCVCVCYACVCYVCIQDTTEDQHCLLMWFILSKYFNYNYNYNYKYSSYSHAWVSATYMCYMYVIISETFIGILYAAYNGWITTIKICTKTDELLVTMDLTA